MLRHILVIAALASLLAGCQEPPEAVVRSLAASAGAGDWDGFADRLTQRSQAMFRGSLAAAPDSRALLAPEGLPDTVEVLAVGQEGDVARVEVRGGDGEPWPMILVQEGGEWRVDLFECQRVWSRLRLQRQRPVFPVGGG